MAISSRGAACSALTFSKPAHTSSNPPISVAPAPSQRSKPRSAALLAAAAAEAARGGLWSSRGGAGILERPTFDLSQFDFVPVAQEGGDMGKLCDVKGLQSGDGYKVLLIDDPTHTEELVVEVLPQVVPSITLDGARELFHDSRQIGLAVVIITVKEHAEFYAQMMIRHGLRSAIEADSNWKLE